MLQKSATIKLFSLLCFILLGAMSFKAQRIVPFEGPFTTPPANKNMLFYLQRTVDANTVIYETNYAEDGKIDRKKPIKIYWIDFADGGKISQLTYMQNKFAYGIDFLELEGAETVFEINLVSYKKIHMYLKPTGKNGSYEMHVIINGRPAILTNIMVNITGGTYLRPNVAFIELAGKDLASGEKVIEKIKPS